jgi:hypothetical protein
MTECRGTFRFDGPVSPVSGRFPLGLGSFAAPRSDQLPSERGVQPFGLRFAQVAARSDEGLPAWWYCHHRQVAMAGDGSAEPFYRRFAVGKGSMDTTGPSPDGQGSTGNEEWTPDYQGDDAA